MSKGSKSRVTDKKRFDENFDAIEWYEKYQKPAEEFHREFYCDWIPGEKENPPDEPESSEIGLKKSKS